MEHPAEANSWYGLTPALAADAQQTRKQQPASACGTWAFLAPFEAIANEEVYC